MNSISLFFLVMITTTMHVFSMDNRPAQEDEYRKVCVTAARDLFESPNNPVVLERYGQAKLALGLFGSAYRFLHKVMMQNQKYGRLKKSISLADPRSLVEKNEESITENESIRRMARLIEQRLRNIYNTLFVRSDKHTIADVLLHMPFIDALQRTGCSMVIASVPGPVKSLMQRKKQGWIKDQAPLMVVSIDDNRPQYDFDLYLADLPYFVSNNGAQGVKRLEDIPRGINFFAPIYQLVERWKERMSFEHGKPILIAPTTTETKRFENLFIELSIGYKAVMPLRKAKNAELYVLPGITTQLPYTQKDLKIKIPTQNLISSEEYNALHFADNVSDSDEQKLEEAAAMMEAAKQLGGIVVGCDNELAYMAGAMDVPAVVLLGYRADPKWGCNDEAGTVKQSRWFASLKQCQQSKEDGWNPVLERVVEYIDEG